MFFIHLDLPLYCFFLWSNLIEDNQYSQFFMELLKTTPLFRVRISDLEQIIRDNKRTRDKPDSDTLPNNQDPSHLSVRQWTVHSQRPGKPLPCKCPFHHKPSIGGEIRHLPGCRHSQTVSDHQENKFQPQMKKFQRMPLAKVVDPQLRPETSQSELSIDRACKKSQLRSSMQQPRFQTCQSESPNKVPGKAKAQYRFSRGRVEEIGKRISNIGHHISQQPNSDMNARYLRHFDDFKYKYLQVVRFLTRHGYQLQDSADVKKTTEFLDKIFKDMRSFESQIHYKGRRSRKNQMRCSQLWKQAKVQSSGESKETIINKKSKRNMKTKTDIGDRNLTSKNQCLSEISILRDDVSFHSASFKVRSFQYISLRDLLQDIEDQKIIQIAHADREELIEGLELIQNQLEKELFKTKTTRTVADFISQGKTSNLIERVLRTVQVSTILSSNQITNRSELLQDGLRKIHKYQAQIKSQGVDRGTRSQASQLSDLSEISSIKKLRRGHRHGQLSSKKISERDISNSASDEHSSNSAVTQKPKKKVSIISPVNPNQNIANKVFAKEKHPNQSVHESVPPPQQTQLKQQNVIKQQSQSSDSQDDYESDLVTKIKASRRRRGINKINMKGTDEVLENFFAAQCESDRQDQPFNQQKRVGRRRASLKNSIDLQQLNKFRSPLVRMHKLKIKHIVQDINELLISKNLAVFRITKDDSNMIRRRKLRRLKKFIQKQPQYYDRQLVRSINLYEQHERLTKEAKIECTNYLDNFEAKDDEIVLATINAAMKKTIGLKWTDEIKKVQKKEQLSAEVSSDDEIYLKQPKNKKSVLEENFKAKVRGQIKQLKDNKMQNFGQQDLLQMELICKRAFQDLYVKHQRRQRNKNILKTEPSFNDKEDSKQKIRALIKTVHKVNRPLFDDLISQPTKFR